MPAIFVSYARPDEAVAGKVREALAGAGYDVWWDEDLPAHRDYSEVIQERLSDAAAVVVLWSEDAAKSQWVKAEADFARNRGTLVQGSIDGSLPPLPFNQVQCAKLEGWNGGVTPGWGKLLASIAELAGPATAETPEPRKAAGPSICVLPFQNMSGDAEQEYFSDGISEDITTDLSKVSALTVISRNTAFQFKSEAIDVIAVARKLGVTHVLEGSVRKAGNRVRITAQLIDGSDGGHVWAERYDRDLNDIFAIQDELSRAIVDALKVKLLPKEKKAIEKRGTANVEAYNLYLMARQIWINGNYGDVRRDNVVTRIARRAIDLDPGYARAWALLAIAQANLRYHHGLEGEDGLAAAEKALSLDPAIAEAYVVKARDLAERADYAGADAMIQKGLSLNPDSWEINREAARLAITQRKVEEATHYYERAAELDDTDFHSPMMLLTCHIATKDEVAIQREARRMIERAEKAIAQDPLNASAIGVTAGGYAYLGNVEQARERHERAMVLDPDNINMPYNFACVLATRLNEPDEAMDLIEPLFRRVSPSLLLTSLTDPDMDCLRDNERFIAAARGAIERTGLDPARIPIEMRESILGAR